MDSILMLYSNFKLGEKSDFQKNMFISLNKQLSKLNLGIFKLLPTPYFVHIFLTPNNLGLFHLWILLTIVMHIPLFKHFFCECGLISS